MKSIASMILAVCLQAAAFAQPQVPRVAANLRIVDSSGKPFELLKNRGKVVLMQFLYTTCSHCQATARMLSKLQSEMGSSGLQVLGVAFNPDAQGRPDVIADFLMTNGIQFPVGAASPETVMNYLGISIMERFVVPQILVVDREGVIRAHSASLGTPELQDESYLRKLLGSLLQQDARTSRSVKNLDRQQ